MIANDIPAIPSPRLGAESWQRVSVGVRIGSREVNHFRVHVSGEFGYHKTGRIGADMQRPASYGGKPKLHTRHGRNAGR